STAIPAPVSAAETGAAAARHDPVGIAHVVVVAALGIVDALAARAILHQAAAAYRDDGAAVAHRNGVAAALGRGRTSRQHQDGRRNRKCDFHDRPPDVFAPGTIVGAIITKRQGTARG